MIIFVLTLWVVSASRLLLSSKQPSTVSSAYQHILNRF
jgi:hypothetical protein